MHRLLPPSVVIAVALVAALAGCGGSHRARHDAPSPFGHRLARAEIHLLAAPPLAARERRAVARLVRTHPVIVHGGRGVREVALTFDDGPGPYTQRVLRVLRRRHAPGTFFLVGQMIGFFRPALREEHRAGETIGDHTVAHAALTQFGAAGQRAQIAPVARYLGVRLFRPPYRLYDAETVRIARRLGLLTILWDVEADDWQRPGTAVIVRNVLRAVRAGSIVGMHDAGGDRSQTIAALPAIITGLRCRGYRLVSVPRLLADDPPGFRPG